MSGYRPGCTCGGHYQRVSRGLFRRPALGDYIHAPGCPFTDPGYRPRPPKGGAGIGQMK